MYTELCSFIYDKTLFCSLSLEFIDKKHFAKLNLRGVVSCMPAARLFLLWDGGQGACVKFLISQNV